MNLDHVIIAEQRVYYAECATCRWETDVTYDTREEVERVAAEHERTHGDG